MSATLKLTHKAIGAEVRRDSYDVVVDDQRIGSVKMNDTIEIPIDLGRHTLQVRDGRKSAALKSSTQPRTRLSFSGVLERGSCRFSWLPSFSPSLH